VRRAKEEGKERQATHQSQTERKTYKFPLVLVWLGGVDTSLLSEAAGRRGDHLLLSLEKNRNYQL
jgi:hypothetical protein